jgi:DnaK suppressor protein
MLAQKAVTQRENQLLQEMDQVQTSLQFIESRCVCGLDGRGDITDQADRTLELANDLALYCLYEQSLVHLERALARLDAGQYGICESCGAQIDPARLEAIPHATLCVRCQRRKEWHN